MDLRINPNIKIGTTNFKLSDLITSITTFTFVLNNGYSYENEIGWNKGWYDNRTKQVTISYFIRGTIDNTWRKIGTISNADYRPKR